MTRSIHCAAYTAVDAAEDNVDVCHESQRRRNREISRKSAKNSAFKMMYISTDYVFDGQGTRPWEPDDREDIR